MCNLVFFYIRLIKVDLIIITRPDHIKSNPIMIQRTLGKVYNFTPTTVTGLINKRNQIFPALDANGCICIKNVDLNEKQQIELTKRMFKRVIELPRELSLNNKDQSNKEVVRVGNVLLDGSIKDASKEAIAWHQDGDFWGEHRKHTYSLLQSKIEPQTGGETLFLDLVKGAEFLKTKKPDIYSQLKQSKGVLNMLEIDDYRNNKYQNNLGIPSVTEHEMIRIDPRNGTEMLYLGAQKIINKNSQQQSKIKTDQILDLLQKQLGYYTHRYAKGDFVIWDNTQVIHRAIGTCTGRRLLFRTLGSQQL